MSYYQRSSDNRSRRYARACQRVESGVRGRDISRVFRCVLTTRLGDDNSWGKMQKDIRKLRQQLSYKGVEFEYVFMPHISGKNALLHLDGLVWLCRGLLSLFELQVLWSGIHGATEVKFDMVVSLEAVLQYAVSHMFKDYDKVIGFKGRMLISKGWMPEGWLEVDKALSKQALNKVSSLGRAAWVLKRELYLRWLDWERISGLSVEYGRMVSFERKGR